MDTRQAKLMLEEVLNICEEEGLDRSSFIAPPHSKRITGQIIAEDSEWGVYYATEDNRIGYAVGIWVGYAVNKGTEDLPKKQVVGMDQLSKYELQFYLADREGERVHEVIVQDGKFKILKTFDQCLPVKQLKPYRDIKKYVREAIGPEVRALTKAYLSHK